jgi:hypothetical protein
MNHASRPAGARVAHAPSTPARPGLSTARSATLSAERTTARSPDDVRRAPQSSASVQRPGGQTSTEHTGNYADRKEGAREDSTPEADQDADVGWGTLW